MQTALIFNIQKFSIHDGPGIRTTLFFKGCPLACQWCHNPESQSYGNEILVNSERCTGCGRCQKNCPQGAIEIVEKQVIWDVTKCIQCGNCVNGCYYDGRQFVGKTYTVQDLMIEIEKDRPFYEQSGGGVTLSGGEVMTHIDFVEELVKACKEQGISVAIDTCGYAPQENFMRIMEYIDVFLYDLKCVDHKLHRQYTGKNNNLILENLKFLSDRGANINLRLPLIAGINTDDRHIQQIIDVIADLRISSINLLPYHNMGTGKYKKINMEYVGERFTRPSDERLAQIQDIFAQANYKIKIGG
ncbi:trans-4-hydroxy-L-proline dehydratase activase [Pelosinus sp. sgz500959]|uniref:trans-4-hydroxy-L-proline dehydratase activase n=1 Tax=Pelosinus sp. sgz500959 TaxID=3242472 RepID=UPI00366E82F6